MTTLAARPIAPAWQKFFCAACQTERPLSERVKVGKNLSRCGGCARKTRAIKKRQPFDADAPHETPQIPDDVMAAYRESRE